jgi:hypothetical protein
MRRVGHVPLGPRGRPVTRVGAWGLVGVVAAMRVADLGAGAAVPAFVPEVLGPQLSPGQGVERDHLTAHQGAGVHEARPAAGA